MVAYKLLVVVTDYPIFTLDTIFCFTQIQLFYHYYLDIHFRKLL